MHYQSRELALKNYYALKIGDTFTDTEKCFNCGEYYSGYYSINHTLITNSHVIEQCLQNLLKRIEKLEELITK